MNKIKIILCILSLIFVTTACDNKESGTNSKNSNKQMSQSIDREISIDKIYFFYQDSCIHCHHAFEYINKKYPTLKIDKVNINNTNGAVLFLQCARKFKLGSMIGTPLFCIGDNYVMGWGEEQQQKFDSYIKSFLNK